MTDYVLVHGGAHTGWCWERMVPYLKEDPRVGRIAAVGLVGHGSRLDEKPQDQISLEDYIQGIAGAIQEQDLRNVVLVGHSLAGVSIPQAAACVPDRIKRLIFVSTMLPPEGKSVNETLLEININVNPDAAGSEEQLFRHLFCNDLGEATTQWLLSRLGP